MRLTAAEVAGIKRGVAEVFGPDAVVRLFGSRVDDSARGGDIDLLVEAAPDACPPGGDLTLVGLLRRYIGDRRIDVVVHKTDRPPRPIVGIARETGVVL